MKIQRLSVVIPCFNESENIESVLQEWCALFENQQGQYVDALELIVVDDGSTDGTTSHCSVDGKDITLLIIAHTTNLGYGAAIQSGFTASTGDWIVTFDGDGQYAPADFFLLWNAIVENNADVAAGIRVKRADNFLRIFNGRAWTWLMNSSLGLGMVDLDSSFKLYRTSVLNECLPLSSIGAFMWAELFHSLKSSGAKIVQVPIQHRDRIHGSPTGNSPFVIARAFLEWFRFLCHGKEK